MNEKNNELPGPVSRRDFLRRAGKEAVNTGTSLVPGAKLATAALGAAQGPNSWLQRLTKWRQSQQKESADETKESTDTPYEQ